MRGRRNRRSHIWITVLRLQDIAVFAMSDEPGWYYPAQYRMLQDPDAAQRFHDYLKSNELNPKDLGSADWDSVSPIGRSGAD